MIIVDIESSGVDPHKDSLVSVGALDFDNPANQFYEECRIWDGAHINKEALEINGFTREQITDPNRQSDKELVEHFLKWVKSCKEHTIAGQNPAGDREFLRVTAGRYHIDWPLAYRSVDLHSVAYFHMIERGKEPPLTHNHSALNLEAILAYVGLPEQPKPHHGLADAKLEAEAFSRLFYKRVLLGEYDSYPIPPTLK